MKLLRELMEKTTVDGIGSKAHKIVQDALKAVDKHTNTDIIKPYHKHVKYKYVDGQENLLNIIIPTDPGPSGLRVKDGVLSKDAEKESKAKELIGKELENEIKKRVDVEDSSVEVKPRAIVVFVVSDDFANV